MEFEAMNAEMIAFANGTLVRILSLMFIIMGLGIGIARANVMAVVAGIAPGILLANMGTFMEAILQPPTTTSTPSAIVVKSKPPKPAPTQIITSEVFGESGRKAGSLDGKRVATLAASATAEECALFASSPASDWPKFSDKALAVYPGSTTLIQSTNKFGETVLINQHDFLRTLGCLDG